MKTVQCYADTVENSNIKQTSRGFCKHSVYKVININSFTFSKISSEAIFCNCNKLSANIYLKLIQS